MNILNLHLRWPVAILFLYVLVYIPVTGHTMGKYLIDDIVVETQDDKTVIKLEFKLPVHYQWHFPKGFNNQIMISLQPVNTNTVIPDDIREHVRLPANIRDLFEEIYLETTNNRQIQLVLHASKPLNPDIRQIGSSTSLTISITKEQIKNTNDVECTNGEKNETSPE